MLSQTSQWTIESGVLPKKVNDAVAFGQRADGISRALSFGKGKNAHDHFEDVVLVGIVLLGSGDRGRKELKGWIARHPGIAFFVAGSVVQVSAGKVGPADIAEALGRGEVGRFMAYRVLLRMREHKLSPELVATFHKEMALLKSSDLTSPQKSLLYMATYMGGNDQWLERWLSDARTDRRTFAASVYLQRSTAPSVKVLLGGLSDKSQEVRWRCVRLCRLGSFKIPVAVRRALSSDPSIRVRKELAALYGTGNQGEGYGRQERSSSKL